MKTCTIHKLCCAAHKLCCAAFAAALIAGAAVSVFAQDPAPPVKTPPPIGYASIELLWNGQAPGALSSDEADRPKLYCYPAPGPGPHTAVVLLPGGGYTHLVMDKEGGAEARWLNAHGVSAYVLEYRLSPRYLYPWALVDGLRAVRLVRSKAEQWNLRADAVGVWGFSAGGHMAGWLATASPHDIAKIELRVGYRAALLQQHSPQRNEDIEKTSAHPDFAILNYARLDLDPKIPGTFGMKALTGENAPQSLVDELSPVLHVSSETSPSFIYATERDEKVNSLNATSFFNALQQAGVPAELHIFEQGPHGTHMGYDQPKFPELAIYPVLLQHWMQLHGWMSSTF